MTTGQRIAAKRKELALSQEALGAELGVSRQSIYKWESDASLPEIDKLIALSRRFGVPVGWLLGVEEETPAPETLTERQKEFFDLYYNEDLSLGEIAENYGISRQGVRDVIVRAEASMQEIEDKTGLIRRFMQMQPKIVAIEEAAQKIKTLNYRQYENPQLEALAAEIMENTAGLKE